MAQANEKSDRSKNLKGMLAPHSVAIIGASSKQDKAGYQAVKPAQSFHADAYHKKEGFVIEVEAGRAVANYQFLKDLFEATVMVDVHYLGIAVRNVYKRAKDFETVYSFLDTLHASERLKLPLKGILLIGY